MANKCNTCGATVPDNATMCPYCGNAVTPTQPSNAVLSSADEDEPSTGLNWLSLFIPLAGWIMYFVFKEKSPIKAKSCAKWAWIGFAIDVVYGIFNALVE